LGLVCGHLAFFAHSPGDIYIIAEVRRHVMLNLIMRQALDFEKPLVELESKLASLKENGAPEDEIKAVEQQLIEMRRTIFSRLTPWQRVLLARHPLRPYALDYLRMAFSSFSELHGDRLYGDDKAVIGGFAVLGEYRVMVIGTQKGRDAKENVARNFGCAHPEGYRKALRLMRLADKFFLPIITLIDTAGAYPGVGAEERHIAEAIAVNLREMVTLRVPTIAVIIGEGGSGGALGLGVTDRILIMENAYYSVISPEGCAAILWEDRAAAPLAAEVLKLTPQDLLRFRIVDEIIPEPMGGAHVDPHGAATLLKQALLRNLEELLKIPTEERLQQRYNKYRRIGQFLEKKPPSELQQPIQLSDNLGTNNEERSS